MATGKRLTLEYVRKFFEDKGCKLLASEYKNFQTTMPYICECGIRSKISFGNFQNGQRCRDCGIKKQANSLRHSFQEVKQFFSNHKCVLLEKEYKGQLHLMSFVCSCGNKGVVTFKRFKNGARCEKCAIENQRVKQPRRYNLQYARIQFEQQGYKLLATKYVNSKTRMPYVCKCGNIARISLQCLSRNQISCSACKQNSVGEASISEYLKTNNISYRSEVVVPDLNNKRFDFEIKDLFVEYHGRQHYTPSSFGSKKSLAKYKNITRRIQHDFEKTSWCQKNSRKLIIIPFWDYDRIPEILDDFLAGRTLTFSEPPQIVKKYEPMRKKIRDKLGITEPEVLCGLIKPEAKEEAA